MTTTATPTPPDPQPTIVLAGRRYYLPPLQLTGAELVAALRARVAAWKSVSPAGVTQEDVMAFLDDRVAAFCWCAAMRLNDPAWTERHIFEELLRQVEEQARSN